MNDKEIGEALETIARDLSYRFPISTLDAYTHLCGIMRALEEAIEQSAILGVTPQVMMLRFVRGGVQNTQLREPMTGRKATLDEIEFAQHLIGSSEFWRKAWDATLKGMRTFEQLPEIYADFAAALDKPSLTDMEKRQAILNHVLDRADE